MTNDMTEPTQDKAIGIAAMLSKLPYDVVEQDVTDFENGDEVLPGTITHTAVMMFRGASTMRFIMEAQAATEKARAELMG